MHICSLDERAWFDRSMVLEAQAASNPVRRAALALCVEGAWCEQLGTFRDGHKVSCYPSPSPSPSPNPSPSPSSSRPSGRATRRLLTILAYSPLTNDYYVLQQGLLRRRGLAGQEEARLGRAARRVPGKCLVGHGKYTDHHG